MFAFENWHSALEMKLYFQRFIHHIAGLPDFSALKFTKYNQYESLILPMQKYLEAAGVDIPVQYRSYKRTALSLKVARRLPRQSSAK